MKSALAAIMTVPIATPSSQACARGAADTRLVFHEDGERRPFARARLTERDLRWHDRSGTATTGNLPMPGPRTIVLDIEGISRETLDLLGLRDHPQLAAQPASARLQVDQRRRAGAVPKPSAVISRINLPVLRRRPRHSLNARAHQFQPTRKTINAAARQ
jgi:hypothetical protein